MKHTKLFLPFALLLIVPKFSLTAQSAPQNPGKTWLAVNIVKDNAKTDYEKWMWEIFKPTLKMSHDPVMTKQLKGLRWLKPVQQNDDKTWTYCFLFDPVVPNGDYSLENYLIKSYGAEKGKMYMQQYNGFMANDGHEHIMNEDMSFYK